jgi:hypothetical protein
MALEFIQAYAGSGTKLELVPLSNRFSVQVLPETTMKIFENASNIQICLTLKKQSG